MASSPKHPVPPVSPGDRFGRLTVIEVLARDSPKNPPKGLKPCVRCACDCGTEHITSLYYLRRGSTRSCGCLRSEIQSRIHRTHGMTHSPEYYIWQSMWQRTTDPNHISYPSYGARGIRVCEEWKDFATFYHDVGPRPSPDHSIDRIDVNGHYEKSNFRWATRIEQCRNKRNNHYLTYNGKTDTLSGWAETTGINCHTLEKRLRDGWSTEHALTTPPRAKETKWLTFDGRTQTIAQWARETGISVGGIEYRLECGQSIEQALTNPSNRFRLIEFQGETLTLTEWSRKQNINLATLHTRLRKGWSIKEALTTPVNKPLKR